MTPRFIVLEALDGVGKTTLVQSLAQALGGVAMNTPGPELRALGPGLLAGIGPDQTARALFYGATVRAQGVAARRIVDGGRSVVMDRYWLSTLSYARARGVQGALEGLEPLLPPADLTLLLTLPEAERVHRIHARGQATAADRETFNPDFRARVLAEMRAPRLPPGLRVDAEVDLSLAAPDRCLQRVLATLSELGVTVPV